MIKPSLPNAVNSSGLWVARTALVSLTLAHVVFATWLFAQGLNGTHWLVGCMVTGLFVVLFSMIAFSFWMASFGFMRRLSKQWTGAMHRSPIRIQSWQRRLQPVKTAILVPVYNEAPDHVFAGVLAMRRSLADRGSTDEFAFFILSDTTQSSIAAQEEALWNAVAEEGPHRIPIYYRRREKNIGRKAGNLEDFCVRWGSQYRYMIVLDADSLMDGKTLQSMVDRMEEKPRLGILQVPPVPINRLSGFARLQQFAARTYGPVFTAGLHCWADNQSNYWGHNAIIRIEPFIQHCGLPILPGQAPLGGEILSHDFVEAALMLRSGWGVELATDLDGSYEECPTNLIDYAIRDQRWCQGNLQHARLVLSEGFHPTSRFHMAMGVLAYAASPLWILFIFLTIWITTTNLNVNSTTLLGWSPQSIVFAMTIAMLFIPKLWGWGDAVLDRRQRQLQGGSWHMLLSVIVESVLSCLLAPCMMVYHSRFVWNTLRGKRIVWNCQNRDENALTWSTAWHHFGPLTMLGILTTLGVCFMSLTSLWWFLPITLGWASTVPLAVVTSDVRCGCRLMQASLFLVPEEVEPPTVLQYKRAFIKRISEHLALNCRV